MDLEKRYKTSEGIECNIIQMVKIEPEWAADIIQWYEAEIVKLKTGKDQVVKHGYHVTTEKKLERYKQTKGILPPVRFFPNKETAERWGTRTGRQIILEIDYKKAYPLPDHKPALWTNEFITEYRIVL